MQNKYKNPFTIKEFIMPSTEIAIIMATYNGALYIREQIKSIQEQTETEWTLLIRDDQSTDNTTKIITEMATKDKRITLIKDNIRSQKSASKNFETLSKIALKLHYNYIFFSDQDDIWNKNKLNLFMKKMKKHEQNHPEKPIMIHSDLTVVNEKNQLLAPSFLQYQGLKNEPENKINTLITQNYITGCASLVNRTLLQYSLPFPSNIIMHDWWLALCCALIGHISYINTPLTRYRQHQSNCLGAKGIWAKFNPLKNNPIKKWREGEKHLHSTILQANLLLKWYQATTQVDPKSNSKLRLLESYIHILTLPPRKRLKTLKKYKIKRQHWLTNTALKLRIYFIKNP